MPLASHFLTTCFCFVAGSLSYCLSIVLLGRCIAVVNRKDNTHFELGTRLDDHLRISSEYPDPLHSDCPAISKILSIAVSTQIVWPGTTLTLANSPHSPLILELREMTDADKSFELMTYELRCVEGRLFREAQITFEVFQKGSNFRLKATRCPCARSQYLRAFAMLRSEELIKRGYIDAARSTWKRPEAA